VDLDQLYPKELPYFVERADGHKLNLAKVMAEHYETRRKTYAGEVKAERKRIVGEIQATADAERKRIEANAAMGDEERRKLAMAAKADIAVERKRMDLIKQKQNADMEKDLAHELALAETAKKNAEAMAKAEEEEVKRRKAREKAREEAVEVRRQAEAAKMEAEEAKAAEMRRQAAKDHAAEVKAEEERHKVARALVLKRKGEEDASRAAALAADAARVAEVEAKQQDLVRRLQELKEMDAERAAKVAVWQAQMRAESDARLAIQEARMEAARLKDAEIQAKKRADYDAKLEENGRRQKEKLAAEAEAAAKDRKAKDMKETRRLAAVKRTIEEEVQRSERLRGQISKAKEHMEELARAYALANEEKVLAETLHMQDKQEAITRQRRKEEYARLGNLQRIMSQEAVRTIVWRPIDHPSYSHPIPPPRRKRSRTRRSGRPCSATGRRTSGA
jgi:hypothetical protein